MELSILIPARNEMFLSRTVQDILEHIESDTEVIVVMDGGWIEPNIEQHDRVHVIKTGKVVGQRAAGNLACRLAQGKYVMKVDAHCSFDQGFDRKMLEGFMKVGDNVTMVPIMRNLWAFDWKCYHCGWKQYQGPTPEKCGSCGKPDKVRRKMMWIGKENPQSVSYCFDSEPHFQYFNEYKRTEEYKNDIKTGFTKTMSLQGSCFMMTRDNYWKWDVCDEQAGSWGNQGIEVACATWINRGKVLVNHNTWYAHLFRTQGGDFSFPYEQKGKAVMKTKDYIKNKYWDKVKPIVEQFHPVKGWSKEDIERL